MGNRATDHSKRKELRRKLELQGVADGEINRRVQELKARQQERRLGALPVPVVAPMVSLEALTPEVCALVLCGRNLRRDETEGNWERFSDALDAFDGVL
jgi:hypothetical protein